MVVEKDGSVEKRMNMSLDAIIKESSKTKKPSAARGKGISVGGKRGQGGLSGKQGRNSDAKTGLGRGKGVSKKTSGRRQDAGAARRGLQATGGQQARKALKPQAPIRKGTGRAPLRIQRGASAPSARNVGNITVSITNDKMRSRGQASQHRPIMPTGATNGPPRQQQQPRYPQPLAYQQPIYSQPPAYYGGGRGGAGLAPLGPGMMDAAPVDYRPARRSDPVGSDLPTYAQHDYRDGPHPNYEMEGGRGGSMYADRESRPNRSRGPSLSGYNSTAERMRYTGTSSQRGRRNERGYFMPGP
ncbi:hypothetical protein WJX84_007071 [Apatococcus fuscideae]|uniref:Uncharacterized protein n=1 Tax=Apatococcus fuscideae TaxID=2026836 RepID=A0AAW1SYR8_9CHLO